MVVPLIPSNLNVPNNFLGRWAGHILASVIKVQADMSRTIGENPFLDWAKIVDCGDAPLPFLVSVVLLCITRWMK